ncbi:MAG: tripartite tricarboxylate transporter permease [Xenococcaceae cyanobacterium MO_167.B27]|nr:tripartite tricarboxylate transporter permease [Xenococcaceae cyanobacterium MO_167.B27]
MDIFDFLLQGFTVALQPINLGVALVGAFIGTLAGALPGIGPINGVAVLLPISYALNLPPETALIMLAGIYYGAEYGGRISSILLNIPGDSSAVMTTLDGYPLAQKGMASQALALSAISSFIGGTIAVIGLTLFAPLLAQVAIKFGPAEYFSLIVFAFATLAVIVGKNPVKTAIAAILGMMISTVGVDSSTGVLRYTYRQPELYDGIDFLIVVIGLFAISEILIMLERANVSKYIPVSLNQSALELGDILKCKWTILRSSIIGFIIGVLPGTGASIASAVAYSVEKRINDQEGTFGKGDIRGLAAPESANNAAAGGAFVPMLTLGIPGSGTTTILLGALLLYNIQPGPMLFADKPEVAGGLIASMYIGNLMLLVLNLPLVNIFAAILLIPNWLLVPGITVMAMVGVLSVHGSILSILSMLAIGLLGYILRKLEYSLIPLILGFVLGELLEENLRRALAISGGEIGILFQSQISQVLWLLTIITSIILPIVRLIHHKLLQQGKS